MQPTTRCFDCGFTLVETLVATGLLITALAGIAQLLGWSVRSTRQSDAQGVALRATQAKLEMLRAAALTYDDNGVEITHPDLDPSPPRALLEDTDGNMDWLDDHGDAVDAEDSASFTRRWAVSPLDERVPAALVIEVCVFRYPADNQEPAAAEACLSTIRSRQP